MNWTHPTGKQPKKVILVCLGNSRQAYIDGAFAHDPPDWFLDTDEVWTLNRGALAFRHDLAFVLDYVSGEAAHYPGYGAMLWKHDRPIITSQKDNWPDHIHEYPFAAIWNWLMSEVKPNHQEWQINSVPMILIYAAWLGVKEIMICGADYQGHSQTEDGASCLSYWIGVLERVGITVKSPHTSQLLGGTGRFIYGYPPDHDPRPEAVARRQRFKRLIGEHQCAAPVS